MAEPEIPHPERLHSDGQVLRVIDANANRAREALRVMEDYARFVLDWPEMCGKIKTLRHNLTEVLRPWTGEAILHRDTPGDVGTGIKTPAENSRDDLAAVIIAAGKRAGEALRALEEFVKILSPAAAAKIESIRYHLYAFEQQLSLTLKPSLNFGSVRLYVLITASACKAPWLTAAEQAIEGGADCLQLREPHLEDAQLLDRARQMVALCRKHNVLSIINNRPDIAMLADADGVHLGQQDLPATQARKIVGNRKIIGVSTHQLSQAKQAQWDGADYIGVGPIFKSATKPRDFVAGLDYAAAVREIPIPRVAIAGIGLENVDDVLKTGITAVAVTAAILGSDNIRTAARKMKEKLMAAPRAV